MAEEQQPDSQPGSEGLQWAVHVHTEDSEARGDLQGSSSRESIIEDFGDAQRLAETQPGSDTGSIQRLSRSTSDLVRHSGTHLTDALTEPQGPLVVVSDSAGEVLQDEAETQIEHLELADSIRAALVRAEAAGRERKEFLPIDALERIATKSSVRGEFARLDSIAPHKVDLYTDQVCDKITTPQGSSSNKKTTRRKIFAILVLMQKLETISDFIDEGLYDNDLPFILAEGPEKWLRELKTNRKRNGNQQPVKLFKGWKIHEIESFDRYQWQLLGPYFVLNTKKHPKVRHYALDSHTILPFIEDEEVKPGGFGDVSRVKIHPAHHNGCDDSAPDTKNPSYAVKRLRCNDKAAFDIEVKNLKRFSNRDHLHLIKLLVTFHHCDRYHLVFPWGDSNLLDFWKSIYPRPDDPPRGHHLAMWFSKQCLGLAQGLKMIHTADIPTKDHMLAPGDPTDGRHGRHGDLKPENIIWFKDYTPDGDMGVLKISDFGGTRYHNTASKSHVHVGGIPVSPTYRAPEYDVTKTVAQSYDIWTLGCVLLEFVIWYVYGWEGVDQFSKNRMEEDNSHIPEDVFFTLVQLEEQKQIGARLKKSVAEAFHDVYNHAGCPDFIHDLLDQIETALLRMRPEKRESIKKIVESLDNIHKTCSRIQDYCTKRTAEPKVVKTVLSMLTASPMDYSPLMKDRINQRGAVQVIDPSVEPFEQGPPSEVSSQTFPDGRPVSRPRLGSVVNIRESSSGRTGSLSSGRNLGSETIQPLDVILNVASRSENDETQNSNPPGVMHQDNTKGIKPPVATASSVGSARVDDVCLKPRASGSVIRGSNEERSGQRLPDDHTSSDESGWTGNQQSLPNREISASYSNGETSAIDRTTHGKPTKTANIFARLWMWMLRPCGS